MSPEFRRVVVLRIQKKQGVIASVVRPSPFRASILLSVRSIELSRLKLYLT